MRSIFKKFIENHPALTVFFSCIIFFISALASIFAYLKAIVSVSFLFSLATVYRVVTYKKGELLSIDRTWGWYKYKFPQEERERRYKEISLKLCTNWFIISVFSFVGWAVIEIVLQLLSFFTDFKFNS